MQIDLSNLKSELKTGAQALLPQLGFTDTKSGYALKAKEGAQLSVSFDGRAFTVTYAARHQFFRGLRLLKERFTGMPFTVTEQSKAKELGIMLDCSRDAVRNVPYLKELIRHLALMGYNQLQLYTEDTYEVDGEPYFGYMRGRYTKNELKEIDAYAETFGIELVPCIQTLAHLNQIFYWPEYQPIHDIDDILLVDDERTYALIDRMFATLSQCVKSRKIHIGMDESHNLGRGKYRDIHGNAKSSDIILRHLRRVVEIAQKYGYAPMMWSDMFFRMEHDGKYYINDPDAVSEAIKKLVPKNVRLVYWDYYNTNAELYENMIESHVRFGCDVAFAGGAWCWSGFAPNNRYAFRTTEVSLAACETKGVDKILMTMWGDDGAECSAFGVLPTLVKVAEWAYGESDFSRAFKALTDMDFDTFMQLEAVNYLKEDIEHIVNVHKPLLYNDCLCGLFDALIKEGDCAKYTQCVKDLRKAEKTAGRYAYLFKTIRSLAEALELKAELGVKTRAAYKAGDRAAITALVNDCYKPLVRKLKAFYAAFEAQWHIENKPFGFECHDYRIGGLIQRVTHCADRLLRYAVGKTDTLPELEEALLSPVGKDMPIGDVRRDALSKIISACRLTW